MCIFVKIPVVILLLWCFPMRKNISLIPWSDIWFAARVTSTETYSSLYVCHTLPHTHCTDTHSTNIHIHIHIHIQTQGERDSNTTQAPFVIPQGLGPLQGSMHEPLKYCTFGPPLPLLVAAEACLMPSLTTAIQQRHHWWFYPLA